MKRIAFIIFLLFEALLPGSGDPQGPIRRFFENKEEGSDYHIDNEPLFSGHLVNNFYAGRNYTPAWFDHEQFSKNGYAMLDYIHQVDQQGLQPEDYHLQLISAYFGKMLCFFTSPDTTEIAKLDILLTDAFMLLGSHLYYGKVKPEVEGVNWNMHRKDPELRLDLKLADILASGEVCYGLNLLAPDYRSYWLMKDELAFFLDLQDQGWPDLISSLSIKPGESNSIIPDIRQRLIKLRYKLSDSISVIYDDELEQQLKLFQTDWGLNTDGVIGKATLEDMNSRPLKLISRLKVNMERLRWLPARMTGKYILINIANFKLDLISDNDTLISMKAIVGKEERMTPVFSDRLTYIVFSPSWTVPETILKDDVIPELLKGPGYLEKKKMKLIRRDGSESAYKDVDWSKVSKDNFPYTVRQDPGPANSLGRVKFMFPNTYDVYIHDTPARDLFSRDDRAMSSGCVRVEKPFDLAVLLLSGTPEWTSSRILDAMQQDREQAVHLKTPVDVLLIYMTAWTDGKDRIQFRRDIYQMDDIVLVALSQRPEVVHLKTIL